MSRLEREGLSPQQATGIMTALEDVVKESMSSLVANLVTRSEQEKVSLTEDMTGRGTHANLMPPASIYAKGRLRAAV